MRTTLLRLFFFALVGSFAMPYAMGQAQTPDCNSCVCAPTGFNLQPILTAPAAPIGTFVQAGCAAGQTYRRFQVIAGNSYRVDLCNSATSFNTVLSIHSNAGTFPIIANTCNDDGCAVAGGHASVIFNPTVSGTYRGYFFVGSCGLGNEIAAGVTFRVTYLGPVPAPTNDEPCTATPFALPLPNGCTAPISGTTLGATNTVSNGLGAAPLVPTSECTAPAVQYNGGDVWFQVPVPPSGLLGIATTDGGVCAGGFALYTAPDCAAGPYTMLAGSGVNTGLCAIEGVSAPSGGDAGVVINGPALGLVPGQMVYIRYWERNNNENGTFTICAYEPLPPPNDLPCGALSIPTALNCTPVEYNTENAQPLTGVTVLPAISCVGPVTTSDVWFAVTVPPSGAMTIEGTAGTLTDMAMSWYRLTSGPATLCAAPTMTQIGCDNNSGPGNMPRINSQTSGIGLVVGETIYVRLWNQPDNLFGTFSLCAVENIPPPNDNPCGAITLDVTPSCEPLVATTESASGTPPAFPGGVILPPVPGCAPGLNTDVWFTVTVPTDLIAPFGISFQTTAGILLDGAFQVYAAAGGCATSNLSLTPIGACQAGAPMPTLTLNVPTITPGQQLYIRMWRQVAPDGNFSICAVRTDPIPCVGSVTDPGGPTANYVNNENNTQTVCSSKAGDVVTLTFSQFILENNFDYLYIYDGPTIASPLIGTYTGTNSPGTITATISAGNPTGCLTLRFTSDFSIVAAGFIAKITCSTPPILPPNPPGICGDLVYDPGGPAGSYPSNIGNAPILPYVVTYCSTAGPGTVVTLDFSQFNVEANWDQLFIHDGPTVGSPLIPSGNGNSFFGPFAANGPDAWWGNSIPDISSTGTCITLRFYSDNLIELSGWAATVICGPPPPPPPPAGTSCGNTFLDPGGNGNYANGLNWTQTICAPAGQVVNITFNSFNTEVGWDGLYVYDGPNTASPPIPSGNGTGIGPIVAFGPGAYWGTGIPGPFISSGQCLTFRFFTDASVVRSGWSALISCAPRAPNDNPCAPFPATVLPVNPTCSYTTSNNTNAGATVGIANTGCGNYQGGDVWFSFTSPADGEVLITSEAGTLVDGGMALYSAASCAGPFVMVECDDDDGPGNMPEIDRRCNPLAANTVYYVRMWGYNGTRGDFGICVTEGYTATPQGDCLGAFTLCTGDPVSAGFANPGCANDLSNINWGCLSGGERIGSWYAFAANTSGTLGMTITPNGDEDYDWAIWGPFPAGNTMSTLCPLPSGAPKRCSFTSAYTTDAATGSYATGMGNAAYAAPQYGAPATPYTDVVDGWTPGFSSVNVGEIFIMFVNDYHHTTSGYDVTWQMGAPNMLDCMILPVELLELVAHPRTSTVDLTWSTASENNSSHFVVERSGDGERFEQIGTVTAAGNTQQLTRYAFTDEFPLMGVNYYRLTQVDFDGAAALSNTVSAEFKQRTEVIVVPNPARDNAELVFSETQEDVLLIRITDSGGRAVGETRSVEGVQRVTLPIEKLERGTYFVRITTLEGAPRGVTPFVKQ